MDIPVLFSSLIILLGFVLIFSVAGLTLIIVDNAPKLNKVFELRRYKELLRHEVYRYRLSSMLRYLGIRIDNYIMNLPEEEIRKHLTRCRTCHNVPTCDRCLRNGETINNMNFCPNYPFLFAYSKIST